MEIKQIEFYKKNIQNLNLKTLQERLKILYREYDLEPSGTKKLNLNNLKTVYENRIIEIKRRNKILREEQ